MKALSLSGTAVSPRPEQSTPPSPSQLQEAGQGGGEAPPLGPAELPKPQAKKPSRAKHRIASPSGACGSLAPGSGEAARAGSLRRTIPAPRPLQGASPAALAPRGAERSPCYRSSLPTSVPSASGASRPLSPSGFPSTPCTRSQHFFSVSPCSLPLH